MNRDPGPRAFVTTEWSVVLAAAATDRLSARSSLERLCATYWYPLYAFVRRQGNAPEAAEDLTQAFFARLLDTDLLGAVDREKGRFRSFLLACLRHFLANEYDRERAARRGGGRRTISLDAATAESRYALEPACDLAPERFYERRWALTVLQTALETVRHEYASDGRGDLFEQLKGSIGGEGGRPYRELSETLGISEGAVKVAVHRLRRRYGLAVRREIERTVRDPADIDAELAALGEALATSDLG